MSRDRKLPASPMDELRQNLEGLGLLATLACLDPAIEQAQTLGQGYVSFLSGLINQEVMARAESATRRRLKASELPAVKTFDTFDWTFQPGLNVQLAKDLMNLEFIRQKRPLLILGRAGTGKTHLSLAYGHLAVLAGYSVRWFSVSKLLEKLFASLADNTVDRLIARLSRVDLLILDDLRQVPPRPEYASLLFDLIETRHQKHAIVVSSNLSVDAWGRVLGNPALTSPLVDRLMERAHVLNIRRGRSYRTQGPDAPPESDRPSEIADAADEPV